MEKYEVKPLKKGKNIRVSVPGSKSITNRALLMAALSQGTVCLDGVLFSDDSRYFLKALQDLGFETIVEEDKKQVIVHGMGGSIPKKSGSIYVGSAGTAARFLTAMLALSGGSYEIQASEQMKKRPMKALFLALEQAGVVFEYLEQPYFLPVKVCGRTLKKNKVILDISETSQPLSALLMTGVMGDGMTIQISSEKKNGSYIEITRQMMKAFGCDTDFNGTTYEVKPGSSYQIERYQIEPDLSGACYFYAIAAVTGGTALVSHIHRDTLQGDIRFLDTLVEMGCRLQETPQGILLTAPEHGVLHGITVDMNQFSDQALTLAAVAVFADGPVTIRGIGHIRLQECDRIHAIAENMKRLGIHCEEGTDWITIYPGETVPAEIETYDDHRVAMAFTVIGMARTGVTIQNPMCCRKTFETYFDIIESL